MATGKVAEYLDEDLVCSVCLDLFEDPVILECGHNFCRSCIDKVWDREEILSCPECRADCPVKRYTINRLLAKMVGKAQVKQEETKGRKPQQGQKSHCEPGSQQCLEHKEGLKLFCKEDESPICVICVVSQKHAGHTFLSLREAVSMFQEKMKTATDVLRLKLEYITVLQLKQEGKISYIQDKTHSLEQNITTEFARLHQFLQDKEQQLIQQLKEEANGILEKMKKSLNEIQKMAEVIQRQISDSHSTLQQEDPLHFLSVAQRETGEDMENSPREMVKSVEMVKLLPELDVNEQQMKNLFVPEGKKVSEQSNIVEIMQINSEEIFQQRFSFSGEKIAEDLAFVVCISIVVESIEDFSCLAMWSSECSSKVRPYRSQFIFIQQIFQCNQLTKKVHNIKIMLFSSTQSLKSETERNKDCQEVQTDAVELISEDLTQGMYKGPLQYKVWKEMLSILFPVPSPLTLDPDTAYPYLILSEDLTSVRDDDVIQHLPDNPKRFDCYISVLGKEGFNSGRHYWEVEVKNKTEWDVGVTRESSNRKGEFEMNAKHGYWMMMLRNKNEYTAEDSSLKNVTHTVKPQRIGVYLDYEGEEVSLYNADNMSHIYTYTDKFTETIYPYFSPGLNYKGENSELLKLFHLKL
ncbi:zinc-binding protein A33-like [Protopterus annectens]|uniref:zinc-binding protein A33-like n=1 Tax=Protopterus annectens TaxID=7888 RepID=UPI001CFAAAB2|nr:zinc-binding protein A33-like [Protopterus annectens]